VLAVLPGSRLGEVTRLGNDFFEAAWQVHERIPGLHVVVPAANAACRAVIAEQLSASALPVAHSHLIDGQARTAMVAADVVLLARAPRRWKPCWSSGRWWSATVWPN
jgi:Lipid A disaccharide synthetase